MLICLHLSVCASGHEVDSISSKMLAFPKPLILQACGRSTSLLLKLKDRLQIGTKILLSFRGKEAEPADSFEDVEIQIVG